MKKALIIFLVLAMLMSFTACTLEDVLAMIGVPGTQTPPTEAPTDPPVTEPPAPETNVPKPYTKAEMEALKVAKPGMTEDELRQIVLDYMRAQTNIIWTPSKNLSYYSQTKFMLIAEGNLAGGMPYITVCQSSLYNFMHFYDERNGMLDVEKLQAEKQDWKQIVANQCSGSTYWAWVRVSNSIQFQYCNRILPCNGYIFPDVIAEMLKDVTEYYPSGAGVESITSTKYEIVPAIGREGMYQLYAQMKPADGLIHYDGWTQKTDKDGNVIERTPSAAGHVIMCSSVPVIVYNEDGTIDGSNSYITIRDQTLSLKPTKLENGVECDVYPNWDAVHTFDKLYSTGYLPFTLPEFVGKDDVEIATVTATLNGSAPGTSVKLADLQKMKLDTNYPMSYHTITVKDAAGVVLFEDHIYSLKMNVYSVGKVLDKHILDYEALEALANGSNTVEVTTRVSTGEVLTAYTGTLNK